MPKSKYRSWELDTSTTVSRSTVQKWKRRGVEFEEYSQLCTQSSCSLNIASGVIHGTAEETTSGKTSQSSRSLPTAHHDGAVLRNESSVIGTHDGNPNASPPSPASVCAETSENGHQSVLDDSTSTGSTSSEDDSDEGMLTTSTGTDDCALGRSSCTSQQKLDSPLYDGCRLTEATSLLLIMAHVLKYHDSKEATESLLKVIEAHLPETTNFPSTKHLFFKHFTSTKELLKVHFYCQCMEYLCKDTTDVSALPHGLKCHQCGKQNSKEELLSSGHYFILLSLDVQLRDLMEQHESLIRPRQPATYMVDDIMSSPAYRKLPFQGDDISFTWSTDGVPVFESSQYSVWPLLLQVNELPYRERLNNQILAALWFGAHKPNMNAFLRPFVEEVNLLSKNGFTWTSKSGDERCSKLYPGPCTVDSVARCSMLNMTQFNGRQGCPWCEQEGEVVQVGNGHARVYPVCKEEMVARTDESMKQHAKRAEESGTPSGGVKGSTVLMLLSLFTVTSGFVVDYMHAVCLGFVRTTACMWFTAKGPEKYHIAAKIPEIDRRLQSLKSVWELSRLARPVKVWKYWKASEWRNFLLFFSPVVLNGILPKKFYRNWLKFVQIMHILLGETVPIHRMPAVQRELFAFLHEYQSLYSKERMTYNAHLLLHLVDSVRNWGPLWGYSLFPFEGMNGRLLKYVQGTRHVGTQICEKYLLSLQLPRLLSRNRIPEDSLQVFQEIVKTFKCHKLIKDCAGVLLYGKGIPEGRNVNYRKMSLGPLKFCVQQLDRSRRSNSYVLSNNVFGRLTRITASCENHCRPHKCKCHKNILVQATSFRAIRNVLSVLEKELESNSMFEVEPLNELIEVKPSTLKKCMFFDIDGKSYMCVIHEKLVVEAN